MSRSIRPVRLLQRPDVRSATPDQLAELAGRSELHNQLDAEALAAARAFQGKELLTAAWSERPSRLLGQRPGQMTYGEGITLYLSQGAAMQHTAANRGQDEGSCSKQPLRAAVANVADAGGGGAAGLATTEPRCCSAQHAVEAAMQHLPDVESHLEPEALALALSSAPTSTAAVHVAALADAAWRRVPSRVLGPRPCWLDGHAAHRAPDWRYGELLQLCAVVGYERVKKELAQPCTELACLELELHPLSKEALLKLDAAIENVERIFGASFPTLLERGIRRGMRGMRGVSASRDGWGTGLSQALKDVLDDLSPRTNNGILTTTEEQPPPTWSTWWWCSSAPVAVEGELLQLQCIQDGSGQRAVEFRPPRRLPPPADISNYEFPASLSTALLPWATVRCGRDLAVKGWGPLPISLDTLEATQSITFEFLPPPAHVRAQGYAAAHFPAADHYARLRIHRILAHPGSPLAQYIVKWSSRLNGPLAGRIEELEAARAALGGQGFDQPPETLLRRQERVHVQRALSAVPLEEFGWLAAAGHSGDEPRILASKTDSDGATWNVLLLTTSHQVAMAGLTLKNCVGRSLLWSHISAVRGQAEMLLVLCPGKDIQEVKAMASWGGEWTEIYESCNQPIRSAWKDMFMQAEVPVQRIWDARPSLQQCLQR